VVAARFVVWNALILRGVGVVVALVENNLQTLAQFLAQWRGDDLVHELGPSCFGAGGGLRGLWLVLFLLVAFLLFFLLFFGLLFSLPLQIFLI
jgi:hypothetical protein